MVMQPRVLTDARVGGYLFLTIADALPHHLIHHPLLLDGGYTAFISFISPPTRLLMCDATVLVPTNSLPSALDDILKHPVYIVGTTRLMAATGNLSWEIVAERATFNAFEGLPFPLYKSVGQLEICLQSVDDYPFAPSAAFSQTYVVECTAISKTQYWSVATKCRFDDVVDTRVGLHVLRGTDHLRNSFPRARVCIDGIVSWACGIPSSFRRDHAKESSFGSAASQKGNSLENGLLLM